MANYWIFEKVVQGFLRFPATRHGVEDAVEDAGPAAMIRRATEAQEKINKQVERIQDTTPKALDPSELLKRQVNDAAEIERKLDDRAWEVDVSVAASKDAFAKSTTEFTELEQALAAPRHVDPNPTDPLAIKELERMAKEKFDTPTGAMQMNKLYLNPTAMKEWQTGFLQKEIDARVVQAKEKLDPLMQAGTNIRRAKEIEQAADDLDAQAKMLSKKYFGSEHKLYWDGGFTSVNMLGQWVGRRNFHGGYWQIARQWLSAEELDRLTKLGVEAIELSYKTERLSIDAAAEKEGLRLLADATDIVKRNPDLALNAEEIDAFQSEYDSIRGEHSSIYHLYKKDSRLSYPYERRLPSARRASLAYPLAHRILGRLKYHDRTVIGPTCQTPEGHAWDDIRGFDYFRNGPPERSFPLWRAPLPYSREP